MSSAPRRRNPGSHSPVLNRDLPLRRLLGGPVLTGTVECIRARRPAGEAPVRAVTQAVLETSMGVHGDHYRGSGGARQVSLIGQENLRAIASFLGAGERGTGTCSGELRGPRSATCWR